MRGKQLFSSISSKYLDTSKGSLESQSLMTSDRKNRNVTNVNEFAHCMGTLANETNVEFITHLRQITNPNLLLD